MNNPYEVLGVSPTATLEQVKDAYRQLAKKYHPDNYTDSPLKDVAEKKMAEINAAYDDVVAQVKGKTSGYSSRQSSTNTYQNSSFYDIRQLIMQRRLVEAEELLNGIPVGRRNAEWYFLKGSIFYSRGWFDDAYNNFNAAVNLDPANPEYQDAFRRMNVNQHANYGTQYNQNQGAYRTPNQGSCNCCDICTALVCADCCCDCMGGSILPC